MPARLSSPIPPPPAASYDAVIVGARCAGAATALLLARAGLSVLAVERSPYGADTLSTHALMRGAVAQLARWGVLDRIRAAGTPAITRTTFHYGDDAVEVPIKPKYGADALYAPRRTVLDTALVDAGRAAGATILHGPRVVELVRRPDGRVSGVVVQDREGGIRTVGAGIVVGADGWRSTVGRLVAARARRIGRHATGVTYGYWAGLPDDGTHWYYRTDAAAGVIPTNDGLTCVFASVPASRFSEVFAGQLEAGCRRVVAHVAPELAADMAGRPPAERVRGFLGEPSCLRQAWGPGWALVGDAGYFKDSLTAHGITDALRDAELLAQAIITGTDAALDGYQDTRDRLAGPVFDATDAIAAFDSDLRTLATLHRALSEGMTAEARYLADLETAVAT
ncbi:MAG: FAD-dependent monooxygenase [Vicinamibacterales bacterium]